MKTKIMLRLSLLPVLFVVLAFAGCSKEDPEEPKANSSSLQQLTVDDNRIERATDDINGDVEFLMSGNNLKSTNYLPCNVTVDSSEVINDTITYYITYNGLNCPETLYRTGKVEVKKQVGTHWYDPGATIIVKYINLSITHVHSGKTTVMNGVKTHQNVTGGLIYMLGYGLNSITHRTTGFVTITFEDNTNRTWNIARQMTYTGTLGAYVMTLEGFGTAGEYTNLVTWGVNRQGEQFYIRTIQSVEFRQVCSFNPCSGIKNIDIPSDNKGATVTFGFNDNNEPVTGNECPTKYKLDWYKNNQSGTIYLYL